MRVRRRGGAVKKASGKKRITSYGKSFKEGYRNLRARLGMSKREASSEAHKLIHAFGGATELGKKGMAKSMRADIARWKTKERRAGRSVAWYNNATKKKKR